MNFMKNYSIEFYLLSQNLRDIHQNISVKIISFSVKRAKIYIFFLNSIENLSNLYLIWKNSRFLKLEQKGSC